MKKIEENLEKLIDYICKCSLENNFLPSVREMANYLGIKSTSTISYYLQILEERGVIKKNSKNKARSFEIADRKKPEPKIETVLMDGLVQVPLVGNVTCGTPILAVENYESIYTFPQNLFNAQDLFMLQAEGESMINAGINSGDYIIVHKQSTANNGDIVVAMMDYHATVKRFFRESTRIRLQPENDTMQPIYTDDCSILGKVVGLIRKMR
ncbi:MAG: transcriptional repressor LexA [Clostridiales bacterium]|nr:transcriptional repressor LexA [Candidatus Apopatousia equi]